jgi:hypothetical protein
LGGSSGTIFFVENRAASPVTDGSDAFATPGAVARMALVIAGAGRLVL